MPSGRIMAAPSWPEVQSRLLWCNPSGWGPADWSSHYFFLRISSFFTTGFKRNTHPHPMIYTTGQKVELFRLQRKTENIRSKVNLGNIGLVSVTHLAGRKWLCTGAMINREISKKRKILYLTIIWDETKRRHK